MLHHKNAFRKSIWLGVALATIVVSQSTLTSADDVPDRPREVAGKHAHLIDALRTTNQAPELVNPGLYQRAKFAQDFDWKENQRVVESIESLESNAIEAWPEIVKHMSDDEYCITVLTIYDSEWTSNRTRGDVCFRIVKNSLNRLYIGLMPGDAPSYQMQVPANSPRELQKWCQERKDKSLEELQIEAAEWAISIISKTSRGEREWNEVCIAEIRKRIATLKESHKPKAGTFLVRDEVIAYDQELVERKRKRREEAERNFIPAPSR